MTKFFAVTTVFLAIVAFGCEQVPSPVQVDIDIPPQTQIVVKEVTVTKIKKVIKEVIKEVEVEKIVEVEVDVPGEPENPVEEKKSWDFLKNIRILLDMPGGYEQSNLTASIEYDGAESIFISEDQFQNHGDSHVVDSTWINILIKKDDQEFLMKVFFEQSAERTRTMVFLFELCSIKENPKPAWEWHVSYEHKLFGKEPWYYRRVWPLPNGLDVDVTWW